AEDLAEARVALSRSGTTSDPRQVVADHWSFHRALYSRAGRPRLLNLIEQHHNLLARYLLPTWAQFGVMNEWASDEVALMELAEQRRVKEAVDWLRQDLDLAKERVIHPARQ